MWPHLKAIQKPCCHSRLWLHPTAPPQELCVLSVCLGALETINVSQTQIGIRGHAFIQSPLKGIHGVGLDSTHKKQQSSCVKNEKKNGFRGNFKPWLLSHLRTPDQSLREVCVCLLDSQVWRVAGHAAIIFTSEFNDPTSSIDTHSIRLSDAMC